MSPMSKKYSSRKKYTANQQVKVERKEERKKEGVGGEGKRQYFTWYIYVTNHVQKERKSTKYKKE